MRCTVLFVWREVGGTHTSEGEAAAARAAGGGLRAAGGQFTVARRVVRPDAGPSPARRRHPTPI